MSRGTGRGVRLGKALVAYAIVAGAVWMAAEPVRRVFLLPPLFTTLLRGLTLLALPVALGAAWRYPGMGDGGRDGEGAP